ncbi:MAG: Asp-tRNA(Asn)/Glu-tRNA(Gln) amidotransferase subunit GatB [Candidatus Vogelbacteria bacterium]|nr:Asp-tRNA(Asn)/Glu-tRNA(Gln) amidotransferase subunit GatB [Candidatus Vogelbacteria bacterium]
MKATIGLEIHTELKTVTKMFCRSKNDPDEKRPNVNICPICLAHPGTLPVINQEAVKHVLRVGLAVGGQLADYTEFDRKNYFYPDIPKGYQISQYRYPLVTGGSLKGITLTRIHLEEDTARSQHDAKSGSSLVDYNRAGVPLMELVTEPVVESAAEAGAFAREWQLLLRTLGVSEANMEKGEMRVEANISLDMGTKVEVKNLNSFRSVEQAIGFELKRQKEVLEKREKVVQETRGWDEVKGVTFSQRLKESSHDYRYFPDPDLPKLRLGQIAEFANLQQTLPELPVAKRTRLTSLGLKPEDVELLVSDLILGLWFDEVVKNLSQEDSVLTAINYTTSDLQSALKTGAKLPEPAHFAELISLIVGGEVSSRGAKDILAVMLTDGGAPRAIAQAKNLFQSSDTDTLAKIIEQVIADNATVFSDFKSGNDKVLQFLVGQGMKISGGSANPQLLMDLFKARR